jgi:hypothetical protein
MENFQRVGAISNAHVGRDFETAAIEVLSAAGIALVKDFAVDVGVSDNKKTHAFDLGSDLPPTLVECKSHRWTTGGNVPSAKMTVWNEAMYYFACAPDKYRKILFVLKDLRNQTGESLARYYIRTYRHLIPPDVEIWEYDEEADRAEVVHGSPS